MKLEAVDLGVIAVYLLLVAALGVWIHRRATRGLASFYLADRSMPWWVLGLAGCSSYIDIGGTMALVGLMYYAGLQAVWATHVFWGWLIISGYMAFQARWIRRSGVMTFAEWNVTRFGEGRATEAARLAASLFLLVLMVCNLMFIAVGVGKFAAEFVGVEPWVATAAVFACVGVYTTLGGFFGVILTDVLQTVMIALAAVLLAVLALQQGDPAALLAEKPAEWNSLVPPWRLWDGYAASTTPAYRMLEPFGPVLLASFGWLVFRVLAGPNVWDFQFFLTARSPRDAALAGGLWTLGYTLRWIIGCAFLVLGLGLVTPGEAFDGEAIMPKVIVGLDTGLRGLLVALLLAALMSTLDAMVNVTSSVAVNDFLKRYARGLSERALVRGGQLASVAALGLGFWFSLQFEEVADAWQTMIFVVVTMILVPATLRWHWWRFGPWAFALGMVGTAGSIVGQVLLAPNLPFERSMPWAIGSSLAWCVLLGFAMPPAPRQVLLRFYADIRPFGFWRRIRREAIAAGLVPEGDRTPYVDALNGVLAAVLQVLLCLVPFLFFLGREAEAGLALGLVGAVGLALRFTWYRTLPARTPPPSA